ncbi:MAG: OmpA family protein [Desulfuromonadales bacterium]
MRKVYRLLMVVFCLLLVSGLVAPADVAAELVKKVDNFVIFIDQSGSMAWAKATPGNQKFEQAVAAVKRLEPETPELGYNSAVATFAPYKTVSQPATYEKGSLAAAVAGISPPFNQLTPMGDGLSDVAPLVDSLSGKTALIVFTDGVSNTGTDPVAQAKELYAENGSNLCIHVVSYADKPAGEQTIAAIRELSGCSVVADAETLATDAGAAQFAKDVLYEERMPAPAPKPKPKPKPVPVPAPAPAPVAKEVVTFNLLFGFDKADITDEMIPVLEQVKMILDEEPDTDFVLSGHTCSIGPETYNQGLSERRAGAVKNWLVSNGVAESRLQAKGYGETQPKYDNTTKEGRKLNRRVEMISR